MKNYNKNISSELSNKGTWQTIGTIIGEKISDIIDVIVDEIYGETKEK